MILIKLIKIILLSEKCFFIKILILVVLLIILNKLREIFKEFYSNFINKLFNYSDGGFALYIIKKHNYIEN